VCVRACRREREKEVGRRYRRGRRCGYRRAAACNASNDCARHTPPKHTATYCNTLQYTAAQCVFEGVFVFYRSLLPLSLTGRFYKISCVQCKHQRCKINSAQTRCHALQHTAKQFVLSGVFVLYRSLLQVSFARAAVRNASNGGARHTPPKNTAVHMRILGPRPHGIQ